MLVGSVRLPTLLIPPVIIFTIYLVLYPSSRPSTPTLSSLSSFAQSPFANEPIPQIHLFLPINEGAAHKDKRFCRAAESAVVNGWTPIIYNWELSGTRELLLKSKVFGMAKLLQSEAHMKHIGKDDLIFLVDALDIWLQLSPQVMARRFLEYDSDIVIGADKMCWPNPRNSHDCTAAPESPLPTGLFFDQDDENKTKDERYTARPAHANSGTVLGRLHAMKDLYIKLIDLMGSDRYAAFHSDQGAFNMLLGDGYLKVDPYFRLFWASAYDVSNAVFMNTRYPPDASISPTDDTTPWELYPALVHNKLTGEVPVAVHFNDYYHKNVLEDWWGLHWWSSTRGRFRDIVKERMENGVLRFVTDEGFEDKPIKEICPTLAVWDM